MGIVNCKQCGKIFNYDGSKICPNCRKAEAENFQKVKDYLYSNPGVSVQDVEEETKVPAKKIIEYLRQGKLEVKGDGNYLLSCEKCGVSIKSGHYCEKCTKEVHDSLSGAANSLKPQKTLLKKSNTNKSRTELMKTKERRKK